MERDINKNNVKFNVKDINNLSYSNLNKANFSEARNEFYRNASDLENYNAIKNRNIQFTNVDNSNWNYDNYTLEQNCDMNGSNVNISSENNASNEINTNNANTNVSDYGIMNYQKKINEFNNNLIKQNYMGYLDSNGVNSNNVYHKINKMNNENPPFNIISNNTDNNAQHFNAMKYSDYYNSNNCIYNTSMLNTSVSYNAKNYLNNSIPCKNDYLKLNLNSVNNVSNHLNFSNLSNSNNINSNPFNSNITSSLNLINYKNSVNSNNMNYTPNMLSLEHTGNINVLKGKNYNLNQFNVINLQESDLSNYSYRKLKNVNLKSNYPTSSCNMISNDIDSSIYICSNNNSNYSNKKQLKIKSINCNDSDVTRKKINSFILSEANACSNDKLLSLDDENINSEQENIKYDNKSHSNITMENRRGKGAKIKNANLINKSYDNQNKRPKGECVIYDNSRNPINLNEDIYDKKKKNTIIKKENKVILKKKKSNIKNITNSPSNNKISKNAEKDRDFVKATSENNSIGVKEQVSSNSNKKQIIVNKRNSYVLRKIINIQTAEDKIADELSYQNNNVKTANKKNYSVNDLIKGDEEKGFLEKNKSTSQENNSNIVKSLSKYDFFMNKNVIIDTVNVGNKRRGNNMQTKYSYEKCNNELSEKQDITHLIDKKRKFNDINEHKNNSKNGKYNGIAKSYDINENKIKIYHDEKNPEDKKISINKNEIQINSKKEIHDKGVTRDKKKKTKKEKLSTSLDLYQKYCNNLHQISREETFNEKIKSTFLLIQKKIGDNCDKLDFLNFKIYLKSKIENLGQYKGTIIILCAILITLIINTIILLYININEININTILSILPIYRLIYVLNFFFLFIFGSFLFMQVYGVNFTYILDLNKKIVDEYYYLINYVIFLLFLTTVSLLVFLLDVLFKLNIFSNIILHVVILCILLVCTTIFPFNFYKYKENNFLFSSLLRVLMSGFFLVNSVNLLDNIMGDILTSLSKTFSDVQYILCFFLSGMDTTAPAKCPIIESYINPILVGMPFYLRFCQCLIRYNNERQTIHIYNMLKYISGICIVICTSFNWAYFGLDIYTSKIILICAYVIGSTYMYIWDVYCDWGLLKEYNYLLRKNNNLMYPPQYYYFAGFFNLIFRLTWAVTIMPINIFPNKEINFFLITFFLMFIEVLRRSIWICFRLENEHVTNASRYRAILWVPKMTKAKEY